jgi:hypothetical protein
MKDREEKKYLLSLDMENKREKSIYAHAHAHAHMWKYKNALLDIIGDKPTKILHRKF